MDVEIRPSDGWVSVTVGQKFSLQHSSKLEELWINIDETKTGAIKLNPGRALTGTVSDFWPGSTLETLFVKVDKGLGIRITGYYSLSSWILVTGSWDDNGVWEDSAVWNG
jgi:hypothetical protein